MAAPSRQSRCGWRGAVSARAAARSGDHSSVRVQRSAASLWAPAHIGRHARIWVFALGHVGEGSSQGHTIKAGHAPAFLSSTRRRCAWVQRPEGRGVDDYGRVDRSFALRQQFHKGRIYLIAPKRSQPRHGPCGSTQVSVAASDIPFVGYRGAQ